MRVGFTGPGNKLPNARMVTAPPMDVYRRALERTIEVLGNEERLARYLQVSLKDLNAWRTGGEIPPLAVLLHCVDLILDDERSSTTWLCFLRDAGAGRGRR